MFRRSLLIGIVIIVTFLLMEVWFKVGSMQNMEAYDLDWDSVGSSVNWR